VVDGGSVAIHRGSHNFVKGSYNSQSRISGDDNIVKYGKQVSVDGDHNVVSPGSAVQVHGTNLTTIGSNVRCEGMYKLCVGGSISIPQITWDPLADDHYITNEAATHEEVNRKILPDVGLALRMASKSERDLKYEGTKLKRMKKELIRWKKMLRKIAGDLEKPVS